MGLVINPRGTSGAGKTELVRRIMTEYAAAGARAEPLRRPGRPRPVGWRFAPPGGACPLAVVGHYEATRGGCDTIPLTDGGLDAAFRLADEFAREGYAVLLEGLQLSGDHARTAALAGSHRVHVLHLDTPLEACIRHVVARRRAGLGARAAIERTAVAGQDGVARAAAALRRDGVHVEHLPFHAALDRARSLLELAAVARSSAPTSPAEVLQRG